MRWRGPDSRWPTSSRCGVNYARTCLEWAKRLEQNRERSVAEAGEKRYRIWQIYVASCAHGFAHEWMNIYQVLARKAGSAVNPIPLTREYVYIRRRSPGAAVDPIPA